MTVGEVKAATRRMFGDHRVRRIKARRLRLLERIPGVPNPMTGLDGLDRKLIPLVSAASPTFLEFGANDGLQQSNTYVLERDHGWSGVLVEPVLDFAAECARNRPLADVICAAVGRPERAGHLMQFDDQDLMTRQGSGRHHAVAVTMSSLLDAMLDGDVGLVVIDVEGFELDALAGLDLGRHRPEFMLIETSAPAEVASLLDGSYGAPTQLSHHDFLFARL